ncbi:concanavalin A-like lectin/glucanase domain-containing protein [Mortierella sp. GBAus27b]|nr:concanavalin A-like lectin/glucanase domain-containing protein [Mortierella sp. GBAus27b]
MIGVDYRPVGVSAIDCLGTETEAKVVKKSTKDPVLKVGSRQKSEGGGAQPKENECLLFSDEFDTLDNSVWRHDLTLTGGGNYEVQAYINNRTNTFVKDGVFYIRPTLTEHRIGAQALRENGVLDMWGTDPGTQCTGNYNYGCFRVAGAGGNILNPIQSGLVRSVNSFKFRYGRVEVRAKMPRGKWIWPAIWMLPAHYQYGSWPASGEIDLVESRGNGPEYPGGGCDKVASTLHWGPSYEFNRFPMTHAEYALPNGKTFADDFHVFTLDWKPEGIKTYVDGKLLLDVPFNNMFKKGKFPAWIDNLWAGSNAAPFDQEFYLIMNVAVAGTSGYFPDGVGNKPWSDKSPHSINEFYAAKDDWYPTWGPESGTDRALAVDYIRVYRHDCPKQRCTVLSQDEPIE